MLLAWTPSSPPDTPHSTSSFLSAMDNDCIASMEQAIIGIQEQQAELNQRLEQLLNAMTQRSNQPTPKTDAPLSPIPSKSRMARPSVPTEFDGNLMENAPKGWHSWTPAKATSDSVWGNLWMNKLKLYGPCPIWNPAVLRSGLPAYSAGNKNCWNV